MKPGRLAIVAAVLATLARAEPVSRTLVGGMLLPAEDAKLVDPLRQGLSRAFTRHPRIKLVTGKELAEWKAAEDKKRRAAKAEEVPAGLQDARGLLQEGKNHYQAIRYEDALTSLLRARKQFILNLQLLRSNRDLIDAHLYLGMTFAGLGQADKAKEEFKRVVYLDPKRELVSKEFPPSALQIFSKARQEVLASEMPRLEVASRPAGADVYVNGRLAGQTPLGVRLYSGEYFVLVEKPGIDPWYQMVTVDAARPPLEVDLEPAAGAVAEPGLFRVREGEEQASEDLGRLFTLANGVKTDYVVLATVQKLADYRLLGQLLEVQSGRFSQVALANVGPTLAGFDRAAADTAATLLGMIGPDGHLTADPQTAGAAQPLGVAAPAEAAPVLRSAKPWYKKWWIYPIILGAGAGIYLGAQQIGGKSGTKIIFDNGGN